MRKSMPLLNLHVKYEVTANNQLAQHSTKIRNGETTGLTQNSANTPKANMSYLI